MDVTWLGQAGFLFENKNLTIIVDPYLSDSCHKKNPRLTRRYPVAESFLQCRPDVIILTHNHLDHTDPETLAHYLDGREDVTVLASKNAWETVRTFGGKHNYVLFEAGTEYSVHGITFKAVPAFHSDEYAVGVVFRADEKSFYVTGDTLFNRKIIESLSEKIDVVFLPVNGAGNNMNLTDACRFAEAIGAVKAVPCHFGLFDEIDLEKAVPTKIFVIPKPFEKVDIG